MGDYIYLSLLYTIVFGLWYCYLLLNQNHCYYFCGTHRFPWICDIKTVLEAIVFQSMLKLSHLFVLLKLIVLH